MSGFRMYLRGVSESLQPEEISQRLGAEPDESTSIGSRRPRSRLRDRMQPGSDMPGQREAARGQKIWSRW
ncbi:DUF4279 domain-containing protein [Streptomyces sp. NPDC001970]